MSSLHASTRGRLRAAAVVIALAALVALWPGAGQAAAGATGPRERSIVVAEPTQPTRRHESAPYHRARAEAVAMDTCQVGDVSSDIRDARVDQETGEGRAVLVISARWAAVRCLVGARPDRVAFVDADGAALRTSVTLLDAAGGVAGVDHEPPGVVADAEPVILDVEHPLAVDLRWYGLDIGSAQGSPAVRPAFLHVWLPGLAGPVGGRWEHGPVYNTGVIELGPVRPTG